MKVIEISFYVLLWGKIKEESVRVRVSFIVSGDVRSPSMFIF